VDLRIAVISSPRSGNTWLRSLLADAYGLEDFAFHNPAEADWSLLPRGCVLQIHWHRTPSFLRTLNDAGFRVVTMMRHPLDVLLSVLQFCQYDRSTLRWLDGENGNERPIYGVMPGSAAFVEYATGRRAAALLSVGTEWWRAPDVCRVRYEDLVADPVGELDRLIRDLGRPSLRPTDEVAGRATVAELRARCQADHHCWQGRPGLWRLLLTTDVARTIARAHPGAFAFGYACDPDESLTPAHADAHWVHLVGVPVADKLYSFALTVQRLSDCQTALEAAQTELLKMHQSYNELYARHNEARGELFHFHELGPLPLAVARQLRILSHYYPLLSAAAKGIVWLLRQGVQLSRVLGRAAWRRGSSALARRRQVSCSNPIPHQQPARPKTRRLEAKKVEKIRGCASPPSARY
jgi:hypothetical protein